ncbi:MAG: hypothetical protein ACI4OS_04095 [Akkermansia sp.]
MTHDTERKILRYTLIANCLFRCLVYLIWALLAGGILLLHVAGMDTPALADKGIAFVRLSHMCGIPVLIAVQLVGLRRMRDPRRSLCLKEIAEALLLLALSLLPQLPSRAAAFLLLLFGSTLLSLLNLRSLCTLLRPTE